VSGIALSLADVDDAVALDAASNAGAAATTTAAPILAASDGTPRSDAALRAARELASRTGAEVELLSVVDTLVLPATDPVVRDAALLEATRCAARHEALAQQLRRVLGPGTGWRIEVAAGVPARALAATAAERGASLVVVGLGSHRIADRLFGSETALQLARLCDAPVLAVPDDLPTLARHVVVATDFTDFAARAAEHALPFLDEGAVVHVVHAVPAAAEVVAAVEPWGLPYERAVRAECERLERTLAERGDRRGIAVRPATLRGDPAHALIDFAATTGADLVVAGSHGANFFQRLVIGSVTTHLVRGARCAVLVVPPPADAATQEARWPELLRGFGARNDARPCVLERRDAAGGVCVQAAGCAFAGAAWDHRDRLVTLFLHEPGPSAARHAHVVDGVRAVRLRREPDGLESLELVREDGESVVRLAR
jgi:nucleotide-binding universal stress UspA family protein